MDDLLVDKSYELKKGDKIWTYKVITHLWNKVNLGPIVNYYSIMIYVLMKVLLKMKVKAIKCFTFYLKSMTFKSHGDRGGGGGVACGSHPAQKVHGLGRSSPWKKVNLGTISKQFQ